MSAHDDLDRLTRVVAASFALLLVAAASTQLRPFNWDTYQPGASLARFDAHRAVLMAGGWLRASLLLPLAGLAAALDRRLGGRDDALVRAGTLLLVVAGVLCAAAGALATVIGVPAEEYQAGSPDAHALTVLADTLFWAQDCLVMFASMALAAGSGLLGLVLRRRTRPSRSWQALVALVPAPCVLLAALSFSGVMGEHTQQPAYAAAWYAAAMSVAVAAWVVWALASAWPAGAGAEAAQSGVRSKPRWMA